MALRFYTGFDYYDETQAARVWFGKLGGTAIPGRFGGQGYQWTNEPGYLITRIPNASTVIVGYAFSLAYADPTNPILLFQDGTTSTSSPITQIDLRVTSDAAIQITRAGVTLATSLPNLFLFGFWNYMEVKLTVSDSAGAVQVRINGQTVVNIASQDTKTSGNNYANMVRWQTFASSGAFLHKLDDIFVMDNVGSFNNNFVGECRVQTQYTAADGFTNDFALTGAPTNWEAVGETVMDDDASYVKSSLVNAIDDYAMETLAVSGSIFGVQVNVANRKDDVGERTIAPVIRSGTTYYEGNMFPCLSDYAVASTIWEKDPDSGSNWTNGSINALTVGTKIVA